MSAKDGSFFSLIRNLIFEVEKKEELGFEDSEDDNSDGEDDEILFRGGGRSSGDDKGYRSEYWYESLEGEVEKNTERSRENQLILTRLDQRTTWMMRILLAIVTAGAVSYVAELMI